jgi:hypothetical protein
MAKARRTAKQRAATRKLVALNKRRSRKSTTRKRRSVKRVIKSVTRRRPMARRRSTRRSVSRSKGLVSPKVKSLLKNAMIGLGAGATISTVGSLVGQPALGQNKLVATGASFLVGGPIAAGITFLLSGGGLGNGGQSQGGMI